MGHATLPTTGNNKQNNSKQQVFFIPLKMNKQSKFAYSSKKILFIGNLEDDKLKSELQKQQHLAHPGAHPYPPLKNGCTNNTTL